MAPEAQGNDSQTGDSGDGGADGGSGDGGTGGGSGGGGTGGDQNGGGGSGAQKETTTSASNIITPYITATALSLFSLALKF
ncbi:unnamed protein product [Rodentolepis nana]|uniref:Uncharacterized protein n=1 Tax=Rodentolepis nana TaxID=102285 RepID=A0A0R3T7G1_RODNA|nr:unnamed protein product [Rodentolepis nana]